MADPIIGILRLYEPGNWRLTGRDNCAVLAGFEAYRENGGHIPEKQVRLGEPSTGERVDVILDVEAFTASAYGALLAASKNEGFQMPPGIKTVLKAKCAKCEFGNNCYIVDALLCDKFPLN